jgi:hypothetical protein
VPDRFLALKFDDRVIRAASSSTTTSHQKTPTGWCTRCPERAEASRSPAAAACASARVTWSTDRTRGPLCQRPRGARPNRTPQVPRRRLLPTEAPATRHGPPSARPGPSIPHPRSRANRARIHRSSPTRPRRIALVPRTPPNQAPGAVTHPHATRFRPPLPFFPSKKRGGDQPRQRPPAPDQATHPLLTTWPSDRAVEGTRGIGCGSFC